MTYCPECGSEVAENDLFCPYCGISLQINKTANDDGALSNTIVIQNSSATPEKSENEQIVAEPSKPTLLENDFEQNDEVIKKENEEAEINENPNQITSENWSFKTESVEIPSELINPVIDFQKQDESEDFLEQSDDIQDTNLESDSNFDAEEKPTDSELAFSSDFDEYVNESDQTPNESDEFNNQEMVSQSIQVEPVRSDLDVISPEIPEESEPIIENDESELIGEEELFESNSESFNAPLIKLQETPAEEAFSNDVDFTFEKSSTDEKSNEFSETTVAEDDVIESIEKPIEDLPEIEYPASKFDSVSIREQEISRETPIENFYQEPAMVNDTTESSFVSPKLNQTENEERRSHTSPNMGVSDTDGKKSKKLQPLEEGAILNGRYEIVRKIGGGGMGAVYLASDKNLGGVLRAVKEMVQSYIEEVQQDKAISDFKRESMLLTSLEHQSIPTIYDYFFDEKEARFYLVMKYISGGDLASRIRSANQGRLDEKEVTEWAIQVADVLDYLHNRQPPIVYRDLKPANIMIDGNSGRVMLIDFGIARWINKEEKGVTAVGTMGYAPPELFSGNVESRSDIYSLGSTMFHLLTGADPQSNPLLIFDFQKHPRPRQINPQLSDQIENILMKSVEYNAVNRFASAAELRNVLEDHLANLKANKVTFGLNKNPASSKMIEESVFCGFCGQKIVSSDMFCAFCGAKQPLANQPNQAGGFISQTTARLLIIGTNELETPAYKIEKDENLVGRRDPMSNIFPEVDLSKYDPQTKISRRHARIWRDGSQFMLEDLGSSNGTVVLPVINETLRLLPHQPYTLTNGDKIRLGDTTLHFIIG